MDDTLKRYAEAGYQKDKQKAVLEGIGTSEFLPLIEAIVREAGMTGLDYSQKQVLEDFLAEWSERDPEAALAWIVEMKNPKDRRELFGTYIGKLAEKDLDRAVDLVSQYGRDEKGDWDLPYQMLSRIASQDADTMLRLVGKFATKGSSYEVDAVFSDGYDFRKALDGLVALTGSLNPGETLAVSPGNLIGEWARRDPAAAWKWLGEGKELSSNGIEDYWKSYASVASTEDVASLLVEAVPRYKTPDAHYRAAFSLFSDRKSPELVEQWIDQMPGERADKVDRLFNVARNSSGGDYDEFKNSFVAHLSPDERVRVFESSFKNGCAQSERQFYQPLLRRLGHSDEQIDAMLPPNTGSK